MDDGSGGRSRRHEYGEQTNASSVGLTLGGILSIKQTPPYRIHARTLLDLIRDDQSYVKESKKTWKMFREKLRLKLYGSACTTTAVPAVASHAHVSTDGNRMIPTPLVPVSVSVSVSSPVNNVSSVTDTQPVNLQTELPVAEESASGDGGGTEPAAVRMSLMSLLEVEASAYVDDGGKEEVAVEEDGGGGGGGGYNNCCVCMVRHKGAAFIPCGHTFCRLCSRELFVKRASCPLCNNLILEILDIF